MIESSNRPCVRRRFTAVAGAVGLTLAAAACGGGETASSDTDGAIKIGATYSLTGPIAAIGKQELAGSKLAVETINAAGGIDGRKLELIVEDDKYAPDQAVLNIRKLVQQSEVVAVVGPGSSNSTVAGGQAAESVKVPLVALPSTVGDIWEGEGTLRWAFGTAGAGQSIGAGCFKNFLKVMAGESVPVKSVAIGVESNPGTLSYIAEIKTVLKENGIEVLEEQEWAGDARDLTTQVNQLVKSKPDAVVLSTQLQSNILATKAFDQLGALGEIPYANCSIVDLPAYYEGVGALAEKPLSYQMVMAADVFPAVKTGQSNDKERQKVVDAFAKYPDVAGVDHISNFTHSGWDAIQVIAKAIDAKGPSAEQIRDGLENLGEHFGATATLDYGPDQHRATYDAFGQMATVVVFKGGKPALPAALAASK